MKNFKTVFLTTLALTLICIITAAGLGLTNELTAKRIEQVQKQAEEQAMKRVIEAAGYTESTVKMNGETYTYYLALSAEGTTSGYIFTTSANGYGGEIKVMTGIDANGAIIAIEVLDVSNETLLHQVP